MYLNSLIDITRITSPDSKPTNVDELNDFAENSMFEFKY